MVLFILFNAEGMSVNQWKIHPYNSSIKTNLINKLKKYGEVFVYNPIFYNFNRFDTTIKNHKYNKDYEFNLKMINIEEHCKKIFSEVYKNDKEFILISHSIGYIFAYYFAFLYKKNVKAIININGCHTKDYYKKWLDQNKIQYVKKIKDKNLKELFSNLEEGKMVKESIEILNQIVKYNIYKQFILLNNIENEIKCPIILFYSVNCKNSIDTMEKFKLSNYLMNLNNNAKVYYYLDKSDFLYFEINKEIINEIKIIINKIQLENII